MKFIKLIKKNYVNKVGERNSNSSYYSSMITPSGLSFEFPFFPYHYDVDALGNVRPNSILVDQLVKKHW